MKGDKNMELNSIKQQLINREHFMLAPYATFSDKSKGRDFEDDDCPIALCKTYTDSFNITFEARGYLSEDDHFIRYEKLKLRIVEDDGWYELVDSVPSAYLRMMLRSTFNSFLASKSKLNVKTEDEWTWLARPFW